MINEDRKNQLLRIISETGYIEVQQLAKKMFTSASTVRRNLTELEKMGLVKRSYGKVTLAGEGLDVPMKLRFQKNHEQKRMIAAKSSEYLQDHTIIFVDGSSTCLHMAPFIRQYKNLTVFTNSVELCTLLADSGIAIYGIGGRLLPRSLAYAGEYAIKTIQTIRFDALFFSCSGYDNDLITDYSEPEAHLRRELIKQSKKKYFLCDTSKIGQTFNYIVGHTCDVTKIITEIE